jgi:hypothetical protein
MDIESRISQLEEEIKETKEEITDILFDIRAFLMEAYTPIPRDMKHVRLHEELEAERR